MKNVFAEVITIGDEILYGQTLDTNTQWIGQKLNEIGIKISRKISIGDDRQEILSTLSEASQRAQIVLFTGGLGPTKDDITKYTLAEYFDSKLERNKEVLQHIEALFKSRGREITQTNERQADLPVACDVITNRMGTAPAMWFEKDDTICISMPGVPYEMKCIMEEEVLPKLKERFTLPIIVHQMIQTVGIGESWLSDKIAHWEDKLPEHIKLAYLPSFGKVKLRLTAVGDDSTMLKEEVERCVDDLLPLISKYVFAIGNISLEEAIGQMLIDQRRKIALAESCSGGYLAHSITAIAGSSAYFQGGIVPYHNDIKVDALNIRKETIDKYGAVSEDCVKEMAEAIRDKMHADYGLATSGIAGPGGGSKDKPVGTIWIAVASPSQTSAYKLTLVRDRLLNIRLTEVALLNLLRKQFPIEYQMVVKKN